jgi:hypothetical protein
MDLSWQNVSLVGAALAFGAFMLYRVRPVIDGKRQSLRVVLKGTRERIESAPDDATRAMALCDAGDACAAAVGRAGASMQFYSRAIRLVPASVAITQRAIAGLSTRPRTLEKVLWRRLARTPWTGDATDASRLALETLARLYHGPLRDKVRAKALEHAAKSLMAN